jgi:hypothetical protein
MGQTRVAWRGARPGQAGSCKRHAAFFVVVATMLTGTLRAETIPVRHPQGSVHGFVVLKTTEGKRIATGDMTQIVHGDRVTSRLVFHFRDGSVDDDTTIFEQRGVFRLLSDHHIQRGPSYPKPIDTLIDAKSGVVTTRTGDGKTKQIHMDLPADLSNGLPPNLLMNVAPSASVTRISYLVPGEKPRLIHISIKPEGYGLFRVGDTHRKAIDYVLHIELGGVAGVVAPMIGKQPGDYHIWILDGATPAFIREEGALYEGGPVWRIEQTSPVFSP